MTIKSWQIFRQAKKKLPKGVLHKIFGKSTRLVDMWSANPSHCEVTARNPLDRLHLLIDELDNAGCEDYARATVDFLSEPLNGQFVPFGDETSDRKDVDGELADLLAAAGEFCARLREVLADGQINTAERIMVKESARNVLKEINQCLDAAGMRGVTGK
jgi:hypothetical protein